MTNLSFGLYINDVLTKGLGRKVRKVFPVFSQVASNMPCVAYRRAKFGQTMTKTPGYPASESVEIEVEIFTETYAPGVSLAEEVRMILESLPESECGIKPRRCYMVDGSEGYSDGAYSQLLVFEMK